MSSPDFYRNAHAYDIAFGDRDFSTECDFLAWCMKTHGQCTAQPVFLEVACGPARHAREFARRGWRSVGLDMSTDMLTYATQAAAKEQVMLETVCADMCEFTLAEPVCLAANMMESLTHLVTNDQVVAHLRAIARNVTPGGIYVIEMAHPEGLWRDNLPNKWTACENGAEVDIVFGLQDDPYDWITQQWTVTTQLTIREPGQPVRFVEEHNNHRWYQAQELAALIDLSAAFSQVWWYGDMLVPPPALDNSDAANRMIVVLRN
ncbi:MAG: class I SAM-dependent methyltransferase [Chloroflexi bacterium]|nr:class I SAM-dependent methyltransferase [Chloroflexota bacterium]MCL5274014.1 class I SAM-dependent methyltransferase [Chloroflexota bacterium]